MSLIVQKFGGTSVADTEKIRAAARKAIRAQKAGHQVVMVVSAMGKNTDTLLDLASQISDEPPAREMDMLLSTGEQVSVALVAMAIHSMGSQAVSLTGGQIGLKTDNSFSKARIQSIDTGRIERLLDAGNIVVAAGFQGIDDDLNITTLGRGGSDTTAVALAAVLGADACEINTDVDGVYTTDPRLLAEARRVDVISYDEMLELASLGAGVMHSRSIEFAKKFEVPIHVRSSFSDQDGTMIVAQPESETAPVSGAALTRDEARVTVLGVPDVPGMSQKIFSAIAAQKVAVDMVVQNVGTSGKADVSFTVAGGELKKTLAALEGILDSLGADGVTHDDQVSKVSVVGLGMAHQKAVAASMFRALAEANVNIHMITTSEIKISCLVPRDQANQALRAVHEAFSLDQRPSDAKTWNEIKASNAKEADVADVVTRLQNDALEALTLTDISIVPAQARVTLDGVPDQVGVAADMFEQIGEAGIFVDMIVQGYDGEDGSTSVSFTVEEADLDAAEKVARAICDKHSMRDVRGASGITKLSVSGIGLRSHTQVGTVLFEQLASAGINVEMIATSELQVNVVIQSDQAGDAAARLKQAFAEALN
ncbi:MAG: aspartate kinase [Rhodopirellula sp.]|jgi:aspartate kinase|uniref:aspartate kinase n=1 Tax=Rhodopirellula europaea SH398 TaxID=1263868 RepID=M5SRT4_9BACT|nr:aspartate kinase [Rhodopirellula europaea]EMI28984.1 aspartate kinase, monofunctional class [Rhodopirellula europaea SH398]MAP08055.1 aspartate kinase [Rhodopirellula sp.]MCR9209689.1 aspartate kinase [bacterium]